MAEQPERLRDEQGMVPKIAPRVQWGTEAGLLPRLHRCECDSRPCVRKKAMADRSGHGFLRQASRITRYMDRTLVTKGGQFDSGATVLAGIFLGVTGPHERDVVVLGFHERRHVAEQLEARAVVVDIRRTNLVGT